MPYDGLFRRTEFSVLEIRKTLFRLVTMKNFDRRKKREALNLSLGSKLIQQLEWKDGV
jgi:hypothetical protein